MMMIHQKPESEKQAYASTWVIWDIKSCPVPDDCDASWVGPYINRSLKNLGYKGPVTITIIGTLTEVPDKLLLSISSSGIVLWHTCSRSVGVTSAMIFSDKEFPPTTNILLIAARSFVSALQNLEVKGYNILPRVFFEKSQETPTTSSEVEILWKSFQKDAMDSEKCIETSECEWVCRICHDSVYENFIGGQGFEDFVNHLFSQGHHERMLSSLLPSKHESYEEDVKAYRDSHLKYVNKERKRKRDTGPEDKREIDYNKIT